MINQQASPTQDAILEFITDYKLAHDGNSPSHLEIARAINKPRGNVYRFLLAMAHRRIIAMEVGGKIALPGGRYIPPE